MRPLQVGIAMFKTAQDLAHEPLPITVSRRLSIVLLGLFFGLLIGLPVLLEAWPNHSLALVNVLYRAG